MEKYLVKNFEGNKVEMTMEEINEELKKFPKDLNAPKFTWKTNKETLLEMAKERHNKKLRLYNTVINTIGIILTLSAAYGLYSLVYTFTHIPTIK